jgi:prepilin-type N-terminal cleavage/methylation domain-containing protein
MNKQTLLSRGFTLIELLVVIAIIGILAAVVIGSLNDARQGGQNASIQQTMTNVRSQAELYYNGPGNYSYSNLCTVSTSTRNGVIAALDVVNASSTQFIDDESATAANSPDDEAARSAACVSNANSYQITVPLADGLNFWCVDATGFSGQLDNGDEPAADAAVCQ